MKVILCGYNWAGCKALFRLHAKKHEIYVYTHEPSPGITDLKTQCKLNDIDFTTEKIKLDNLPFKPDVICSTYYRHIIDKEVIDAADGKIFNLHPSLLPKYRGCSSIPWAIINGEKKTGFTYHYIDEGVDTGNIILQKSIPIYSFDTQLTLYNRIMFEALEYFDEALELVIQRYPGKKQRGAKSYYRRGCPFNAQIDKTWKIDKIERFIRAMIFPPYQAATIYGKEVQNLEEYLKIVDDRNK